MIPVEENLIWIERAGSPSIKGNFDQIHPARLLYGFLKARKNGLLVVTDGVVKLRLYLLEGTPAPYQRGIFAEPEFLRFLQGQNLITEEERHSYAKLAREQKESAVDLLIKRQVVEHGFAARAADLFYRKNVIGLFSWRHGTYVFYDHALPDAEQTPDVAQTLRWIVEGIREKYNPGMIEQRLGKRLRAPLKMVAPLPVPIDQLLERQADRQVAEMIAEGTSLERITAESSLGAIDSRALVFALLTIEYCKFKSSVKRPERLLKEAAASTDPLQRLFRAAESSLDRIRREVAREERQTPADKEEEITVDERAHEAELRRRLLDHMQKMAAGRSAKPEPEPAPEPEPTRPADDSADKTIMDLPEDKPAPRDFADETLMTDLPAPEKPLSSAEEDLLSDPGAAEADYGDADDLTLGEIDPNTPKSGEMFANADELGSNLLDNTREMLFSMEDPPEQIYQLAISLFEQALWPKARETIEIAIQRGYNDAQAKARLGYALYHELAHDPERFRHAAAWVQKAITQSPKESVGYLFLGKLYQEEGDKNMAEMYFVRALEVDRECAEAKESIRRLYQDRRK